MYEHPDYNYKVVRQFSRWDRHTVGNGRHARVH